MFNLNMSLLLKTGLKFWIYSLVMLIKACTKTKGQIWANLKQKIIVWLNIRRFEDTLPVSFFHFYFVCDVKKVTGAFLFCYISVPHTFSVHVETWRSVWPKTITEAFSHNSMKRIQWHWQISCIIFYSPFLRLCFCFLYSLVFYAFS